MIVQCPACNSRYRIREANIPSSGGKIRCPSCAHSFVVYPESKEEDEDRTSITNPNALNQLVSKMATKMPSQEDNSTAIVSRGDVDSIRAFQQMAQDLGDADDGTLEIKNPMEIWKSAQAAIENARAAAAAAGEEESEADEYDAAPTEIVSGGNLPKLPFPSSKPKLPSSGPPLNSTVPTPAVAPPTVPTPSSSSSASFPTSKPVPPMPAMPPKPAMPAMPPAMPAAPPVQEPVRAGASANFPAASASGNFPTSQRAPEPPAPSFPPPKPDPFQEDAYSTQQLPNPFTGANALNPFGTPAQNNTPNPANPFGEPAQNQAPANPFGAPAPAPYNPASASADILAAIEETNNAQAAAATTPKPDAAHQGPWKLKTDFGLTYEFPDVKSLRNWLSSRDEIDGFKLSADGINFFAVKDFPQFERRVGMSQIGLPQPQNLGALPGQMPEAPGGLPSFAQPTFTPPPSSSSSGSFSGPVIPGQYASYHGGPLPAAPAGPPVINEYRPPSRSAADNKLLWGVFVVLVLVAVLVGLQTTGIVDLMGMAGFGKKPIQVAPVTQVKPVEVMENVIPDNVDDEVEGLFKEVRRDLKNKKIQSALDRLTTIETLAPDRAEVFEMRAQAFDALGETDKAEAARVTAKELAAKAAPQPAAQPDAGSKADAGAEPN